MDAELVKKLDDLAGVGWRYLWDPTLRMGLRYHEDGRMEVFRHDSHVKHRLAVDPEPVTDEEFREFIKGLPPMGLRAPR